MPSTMLCLYSANFSLSSQIETTEYIDKVFDLKSKFGTPNLTKFEDLVNKVTLMLKYQPRPAEVEQFYF